MENLKFITKIEETMLYVDELSSLLFDGKIILSHGKIIGIVQKLDYIIKNIEDMEIVTKIEQIMFDVKELNNLMLMGKIVQSYEKSKNILIKLNELRKK
jgi:hypothetical protein